VQGAKSVIYDCLVIILQTDAPIKPCQMTWKMKLLRKLAMVDRRPSENGFWCSYISTSSKMLQRRESPAR